MKTNSERIHYYTTKLAQWTRKAPNMKRFERLQQYKALMNSVLLEGKREKSTHQTYSSETDMTFIVEDVYKGDTLLSTEVKGFYFGEPNEESKSQFLGNLKAEF
jgi:hypothetical protein